jgi:hypothetical protein
MDKDVMSLRNAKGFYKDIKDKIKNIKEKRE